jgi:hypothetical protein
MFSFFEDAPKILNLPSICTLLSAMCTADEDNLRNIEGSNVKVVSEVYVPSCALPRVARLVGGNVQRRPLVHRLRIWGTVKDHYVEVIFKKSPATIPVLKPHLSSFNHNVCFRQFHLNSHPTLPNSLLMLCMIR